MTVKTPSDDKRFMHTVLALLVMAAFIAATFGPYFLNVPDGDGGTIILNGMKVLETLAVLIVGYYFGSTATNSKRNDMLTEAALSPTPKPTQQVEVVNPPENPVQTEEAKP